MNPLASSLRIGARAGEDGRGPADRVRHIRDQSQRTVEVYDPDMTAPSSTTASTAEPDLYVAALQSLDVTICYQPLPLCAAATWHGLTKTLTLSTGATPAEHIEVMSNLWQIANGITTRTWARPRSRHLYVVP